jgi:hypothetical protein
MLKFPLKSFKCLTQWSLDLILVFTFCGSTLLEIYLGENPDCHKAIINEQWL